MDIEKIEFMLNLYKMYLAYIEMKKRNRNSRRWWIRPLNLERNSVG